MSDRIDELGERARWFLEQFDEIDLAGICAREETAKAKAQAAIDRVRKATANSFMAGLNAVDVVRVADVLAALAEPKED